MQATAQKEKIHQLVNTLAACHNLVGIIFQRLQTKKQEGSVSVVSWHNCMNYRL